MNNYNKNLCIMNENDEIIGTEKAITAHLKTDLKLHRAFSVFLFNQSGELLLQKRANEKLVYPKCWTNTCCSHPFINKESFIDPVEDCKMHAIERLKYELGINNIKSEDLVFVNRMIYYANDSNVYGKMIGCNVIKQNYVEFKVSPDVEFGNLGNEDFGEFEIDYIFFCIKDVSCEIRDSEVERIEYVNIKEFKYIVENEMCSPWMRLIEKEIDIFGIYNSLNNL